MRHCYKSALAGLFAASALLGSPELHRDGAVWVETVEGAIPMATPRGTLEVESAGLVSVRGSQSPQVRYRAQIRIRAANEAEARRRVKQVAVSAGTHAGRTKLVVRSTAGSGVQVDLEVTAPTHLERAVLRSTAGLIRVNDLQAYVEAESAAGPIWADNIGGTLIARSGGGPMEIGTVRGRLKAVSGGGPVRAMVVGADVDIESGGGPVEIGETRGAINVVTAGGGIVVRRAGGAVNAQTSGGTIEVGQAGGVVSARTSGGGIQVKAAKDVRCESDAGGIRLRSVSGSLRALTSAGNINAELAAQLAESLLSTGSGDITVVIPSNVAVTVRAQNASGSRIPRIVSEFPEIRVRPVDVNQAMAEGSINGGGPVLTISTANGAIFLRRRN